MGQVVVVALVVVVFLGALLLRLRSEWTRRGPGGGDPESVDRWVTHVCRGDRRD